jgi:DUF4097 and DUF4098 domain-containing protein YvlB
MNKVATLILIGLVAALGACEPDDGTSSQKVNGSVHVPAGKPADTAETVNGNIEVADNAAVTSASTVNGGISLGQNATADTVTTVNGNITLANGAHVSKSAQSVNGGVALRDGSEVLGAVGNVNGKIVLNTAHVAGGIKTVNGSISIFGKSHVEGGILVDKSGTQVIHFGNDIPRIVIGPGATVQGDLRFERDVKLYVSDKATVGPITGATAISFTGDSAPAG